MRAHLWFGRPVLLGAFALLAAGYNYIRDPEALTPPIPERQRFQVWSHGQQQLVHGVRFEGDTLRYVIYFRPPDCDSCAVHVPMAAVDSIRVERVDRTRTDILNFSGFVLTVVSLLFYLTFAHTST